MSQEERDLATHVEICAIRYQGIEEKMDAFDDRLTKIETNVNDLKDQTAQGFNEIKVLLERNASHRQTALISAIGGVVVAVIGVIGYLITH